jgi:hypothetical protein
VESLPWTLTGIPAQDDSPPTADSATCSSEPSSGGQRGVSPRTASTSLTEITVVWAALVPIPMSGHRANRAPTRFAQSGHRAGFVRVVRTDGTFARKRRSPCIVSNEYRALTAERHKIVPIAYEEHARSRLDCNSESAMSAKSIQRESISRSRDLVARSRETPGSAEHLIETTRQTISDSQRLIERATKTCNNHALRSRT